MIVGQNNIQKLEIAVTGLDPAVRPHREIEIISSLYFICNISTRNQIRMIENNLACVHINVVSQSTTATSLFCIDISGILQVPTETRVDVFINWNICFPDNVKACNYHLNAAGYVSRSA